MRENIQLQVARNIILSSTSIVLSCLKCTKIVGCSDTAEELTELTLTPLLTEEGQISKPHPSAP